MEDRDLFTRAMEAYDSAGWHPLGIQAVLDLVPNAVPFTFDGYPDNEVYLHPCGTVVDVLPGQNDTRAAVEHGDCDCEGGQAWARIYVEKRA